MDLSFIINELGEERELYFNAVAPPIMQTSNFGFRTVGEMRSRIQHESEEAFYTRGVNPTVEILCQKLAALEGAEKALAFASGAAAVAAAVLANVKTGEHIVSVAKPYSWTNKLFNTLLPRFGIKTSMVDGTDPENFQKAIRPETRIIFLESPNSFTFELQDIEAVAAIAKKHNIITIIDNSYAGPLYQQPIQMGVDISILSATKYISGHSDTVAGMICGSKLMMEKIFYSEFMTLGGILSPFNAWLLLRGLRTLPIRMEKISLSTEKVVASLAQHPKIQQLLYPYSPAHPQFTLAQKQMLKAPGLFTIRLKAANVEEVELFCNSLRRFLMAASWGGHESLIFPACASYPAHIKSGSYNLIRFYIGLEEPEVLIEDILQALAKLP